MRVIVLGAGVIGTTTAYYLSRLGCSVTVVDREDSAGNGATYANGGQLSYSHTDAFANPKTVAALPRVLLGREQGLRAKLTAGLIPWGMSFLGQCTRRRARDNTLALLRIALRSSELMDTLRKEVPIDFAYRDAGKLVMLGNEHAVAAAKASAALKKTCGCDTEVVSLDEAIDIEPTLAEMNAEWTAAVFARGDSVADSYAFVQGLKDWLEKNADVRFCFGANAKDIVMQGKRAVGVRLEDKVLEADAIVVCLGAWSAPLLRDAGVRARVVPARGYSITLPPATTSPSVSITSLADRVLFSRINGNVRVAGFADFTNFTTKDDARRTRTLLDTAQRIAPNVADYSVAEVPDWGGFRAMTPDGRPQVGATRVPGLYTNIGHGMLGWTLACASGWDAAQAVNNNR
jgi:D-amino-acid dehydrogenase